MLPSKTWNSYVNSNSQQAAIQTPLNNINSIHSIATNYRQCTIMEGKIPQCVCILFQKI